MKSSGECHAFIWLFNTDSKRSAFLLWAYNGRWFTASGSVFIVD